MRCITAIWPAGPPKLSAATRVQILNASRKVTPCAGACPSGELECRLRRPSSGSPALAVGPVVGLLRRVAAPAIEGIVERHAASSCARSSANMRDKPSEAASRPAPPARGRAAPCRRRARSWPVAAADRCRGRTPRPSCRRCRSRRDGSRTRPRCRTASPPKRSATACDLRRRHEQEYGARIDEAADEPRAGDAVDLRPRARHPDGAAPARRAAEAFRCGPAARRPSSRLRSRPPASPPSMPSCRSQAAAPSLSFSPFWQTTTTALPRYSGDHCVDGAIVAPKRARHSLGSAR